MLKEKFQTQAPNCFLLEQQLTSTIHPPSKYQVLTLNVCTVAVKQKPFELLCLLCGIVEISAHLRCDHHLNGYTYKAELIICMISYVSSHISLDTDTGAGDILLCVTSILVLKLPFVFQKTKPHVCLSVFNPISV
jgi:hypothetical protein